MKRRILLFALLFIGICSAFGWGFHAHKRINELAVFILPSEIFSFYKQHIEYLSKHSVDADRRRYANPDEAPLHYIDADHYGTHPFDSIPKQWRAAVDKYSEDTLKKYGTVPWQIEKMQAKLTEAFRKQNANEIVYLSANIGHYIADAHVPLHTTENYNGQLTHQEGIHSLWEGRIPELLSKQWDFFTGKALFIRDINGAAWKIVEESFNAKDSVLLFEKELSRKWASEDKYVYVNKGKSTKRTYSEGYSNAYNQLLNGMVERRMRQAVLAVGSFWYTAWVNGGKPDMDQLLSAPIHTPSYTLPKDSLLTPKGHVD